MAAQKRDDALATKLKVNTHSILKGLFVADSDFVCACVCTFSSL